MTFGNPSAVDTTASVTVAGVYVVRLTANDGQFQASDDVTLSFTGSGGSNVFEVRVNAPRRCRGDRAAAPCSGGRRPRHDDRHDRHGQPEGQGGHAFQRRRDSARRPITSAYVQFTADEVDTATTSLTIKGQAADNPPTFSTTPFDLTTRPTTTAAASWSPGSWLAVGDAGLAQRADNLAGIVQEIVNRPGWASGNSSSCSSPGSGERVAVANNQNPAPPRSSTSSGAPGRKRRSGDHLERRRRQRVAIPGREPDRRPDVDATDPDPDTLTYSISGGDAARFAINARSGVLTFVTAPNFEAPTDVGANNVYDVTVSVSDGHGGSDSQALAVTVRTSTSSRP